MLRLLPVCSRSRRLLRYISNGKDRYLRFPKTQMSFLLIFRF
nr:MAG TPA: hypothetical protein [Caudoviricetes sp.]